MSDPEDILPVVIRLLHAVRLKQGLSLEALADRAGLHRTGVGLIERGERSPSLTVALQLAAALEVTLSELIAKAELISEGKLNEADALRAEIARILSADLLRNTATFEVFTGLNSQQLLRAVESCYHTLDMIDDQLTSRSLQPIGRLVELANLSSMVGNLIGGALADESSGLYVRNRPHAYPDLLSQAVAVGSLELKVSLEKNKPKGHLPKPGRYITFRYVLADRHGHYVRGRDARGTTVWFWEVRIGDLAIEDFDCSNTEGDSGKTAVVKTEVFKAMPVVFFDPRFCPHPIRRGTYPGFN